MFFFIGGIQPKTVDLDDGTKMCPSCGLYQARSKRIDHYISLFFIPIVRIRKGEPFTVCERCGTFSENISDRKLNKSFGRQVNICRNCGESLNKEFRFCPFCGKPT